MWSVVDVLVVRTRRELQDGITTKPIIIITFIVQINTSANRLLRTCTDIVPSVVPRGTVQWNEIYARQHVQCTLPRASTETQKYEMISHWMLVARSQRNALIISKQKKSASNYLHAVAMEYDMSTIRQSSTKQKNSFQFHGWMPSIRIWLNQFPNRNRTLESINRVL